VLVVFVGSLFLLLSILAMFSIMGTTDFELGQVFRARFLSHSNIVGGRDSRGTRKAALVISDLSIPSWCGIMKISTSFSVHAE